MPTRGLALLLWQSRHPAAAGVDASGYATAVQQSWRGRKHTRILLVGVAAIVSVEVTTWDAVSRHKTLRSRGTGTFTL